MAVTTKARTLDAKSSVVAATGLPRTTSVPDTTNRGPGRPRKLIVADLFSGAGGFSTGAARALSKLGHELSLVVVNHWDVAVASHELNHPTAKHYCQDLASVRPITAVPEGRLDLLLASPTCTYFSRARGSKPTTDQQRMDPWYLITWLTELRVSRLIVENVPEFRDWGPISIKTGRPVESRKGEYFNAWVDAIRRLGFKVDWAVLTCADYGDPTTRQRFFLIARSDKKPLVWPTPTHSRDGVGDLFGAGAAKWRGACEIIDWDYRGRSIYGRKKSLSPKTLMRVLSGIVRFGWQAGYAERLIAFMVTQGVPQADIDEVVRRSQPRPKDRARAEQFLLNRHGENGSVRAHSIDQPMPTADCRGAGYLVEGLIEPFIAVVAHGEKKPSDNARRVRDLGAPLDTIHAGGGAFGLVEPGFTLSQASGGSPRDVGEPVPTILGAGFVSFVAPGFTLSQTSGGSPRNIEEPIPTVLGRGMVSLIAPYYGSGSGETCQSTHDPLATTTTKARFALVSTHGAIVEEVEGQPLVVPFYGTSNCAPTDRPLGAVTGCGHFGMVVPLTHGGGLERVRSTDDPLPTVTGANRGEHGFITAAFGERGGQLPRIHELAAPVPTICAQGAPNMVMAATMPGRTEDYDILFRMLSVSELSRATSLDLPGQPYPLTGTKTEQIKQIGNAVPGATAEALIRAMVS